MPVTICHASIDEKGTVRGGTAGDQTGREVCTRTWFDHNWHTCLRPVSPEVARRSAEAAVWLANSNLVGYDQHQRNSLHWHLRLRHYQYRRLRFRCEADCSSFITACALCAGVKGLEYWRNAPFTGNMVQKFCQSGAYRALTDPALLNGEQNLQVGDILVADGHTVLVVQANK